MACLCQGLKTEIWTRETNSIPFLVFWRDHSWSNLGIICGRRSLYSIRGAIQIYLQHEILVDSVTL